VLDLTGKVIHTLSAKSASEQLKISAANWNSSTYLVKVENPGGLTTKKLLILN
jgi:hypothetical protein